MVAENAPVANGPALSVVVAPYVKAEPYTKPRTEGLVVPISVIDPFNVADVWPIEDAAAVATVGGTQAYVPAPYAPPP